jgi:hypothetical protein
MSAANALLGRFLPKLRPLARRPFFIIRPPGQKILLACGNLPQGWAAPHCHYRPKRMASMVEENQRLLGGDNHMFWFTTLDAIEPGIDIVEKP